jgi:hypothetical protein
LAKHTDLIITYPTEMGGVNQWAVNNFSLSPLCHMKVLAALLGETRENKCHPCFVGTKGRAIQMNSFLRNSFVIIALPCDFSTSVEVKTPQHRCIWLAQIEKSQGSIVIVIVIVESVTFSINYCALG